MKFKQIKWCTSTHGPIDAVNIHKLHPGYVLRSALLTKTRDVKTFDQLWNVILEKREKV